MRFSRSLRKTIAASLAFTMLAIPLAGCSRTVTTGGLTGKGILGDFLVGGIYGGVFGGFMRPGQPLPEGAFILELPRVNDERLLVELVGMDALRYYTHARIATEKLSRMNAQNSKPEEYAKLLQETAQLWKYANRFSDMAEKLAERLEKKEATPGYKPLAMIDNSPFGKEMFFSVAHAREGWGDPRPPEVAEREDNEKARRNWKPVEWAQDIVDTYEKFPAGKGIRGLSKVLRVDAKEANDQFERAVAHLNRSYVGGFINLSTQEAGQLYDTGMRTAAATKGTCQAALFVGGIVLSGPLLAPGAASTAMQTAIVANWYAGLTDTIVEGVNDAHIVFTGDSNPGLDEAKKYTGTLSALTSGVMLATSFSNFALMGEQAIKNTHDTLQAANLGTKGVLDSYNVGAAGISTILDSSIWTVERGMELSDGKVLGFQVFGGGGGKSVVVPRKYSEEVSQDTFRLPTPIEQLPSPELDELTQDTENAYTGENAPAGIITKDDRKGNEPEGGADSGADSGEASGDIADDSVYAPKNIVGATGSAFETRSNYATVEFYNEESHKIETKTEKMLTADYTHHFQVVLSKEEAQGFFIEDKVKTLFTPMNKVDNSTHRFHVVSYDSGTGLGKLKCWVPATTKDGIFPFRISGKPGSMTIEIENFVWAPK